MTGLNTRNDCNIVRHLVYVSKVVLLQVVNRQRFAKVAELVDALDLGSCGVTRESSSLSFRTVASGLFRPGTGLSDK